MKRTLWVLLLVLTLVILPGCKKKGPPVAGKAAAVDMLRLVPEKPLMVMSFDMHAFASLPLFDKLVSEKKEAKESRPFSDYQDFVNKTGIDLKNDVYYVTLGIYGDLKSAKDGDVGGAANLRYDKDKILKLLAENSVPLIQETYEGFVVYGIKSMEDASGKEFRFAFLDNSNIAVGTPGMIKAVIDVFKGKAKNALADGKLSKVLSKTNTKSLFWMAVGTIPDDIKNQPASGQIPIDLSKIEGFVGYVDYKAKALSGEFKLLCPDQKANEQLVAMINGIKGMIAMGAGTPEGKDVAQLVNGIAVTASGDAVKMSFTLTDDLLEKLMQQAKSKAEAIAESAEAEVPKNPTRP